MGVMTIKDPSVPAGVYVTEFDGVEETTHEQYGDGLLWKFDVVKGRFKGRTVFRTTKTEPTIRNSCGKFLAALAGKAPQDDLAVDPGDYEGERYIVTVCESATGQGTRVDSLVRESVDDSEPGDDSDIEFPPADNL